MFRSRRLRCFHALAFLALLSGGHGAAQAEAGNLDPRALAAVQRCEATWQATHSLTYRDVKRERLRSGKLGQEEVRIKYQRPGRAYLYMLRPVRGREILYDRKRDPNKLTVHNGQFPDLTLSIDAFGSLATSDQHHTMREVGFDEVLRTLRAELDLAARDPRGERLVWLGVGRFDGREVTGVAFMAGSRPARTEVAKRDENLLRFARRVGMEAYPIFVANPGIRSLVSKLEAGRGYTVPGSRAERAEYWFDSGTGMLLKQVMWNAQGQLYESYEHYEMVLNPKLTDADFDPDNPSYGF